MIITFIQCYSLLLSRLTAFLSQVILNLIINRKLTLEKEKKNCHFCQDLNLWPSNHKPSALPTELSPFPEATGKNSCSISNCLRIFYIHCQKHTAPAWYSSLQSLSQVQDIKTVSPGSLPPSPFLPHKCVLSQNQAGLNMTPKLCKTLTTPQPHLPFCYWTAELQLL